MQELAILIFLAFGSFVVAVTVVDQVVMFGDGAILTQTAQSCDNTVLVNVAFVVLMPVKMDFGNMDRAFI